MNKVVVTRPMVGLCGMQVCACKNATDEEILDVCNTENPSGTANGWSLVVRSGEEHTLPVQCVDYPERMHFIVYC